MWSKMVKFALKIFVQTLMINRFLCVRKITLAQIVTLMRQSVAWKNLIYTNVWLDLEVKVKFFVKIMIVQTLTLL